MVHDQWKDFCLIKLSNSMTENLIVKTELSSLIGNSINGNMEIQLNLSIKELNDKISSEGNTTVEGLYIDVNPQVSYLTLQNKKVLGHQIKLRINPGQYWIVKNSNQVFNANINKTNLEYIQENLLGADIQVNWCISGLGFIKQDKNYIIAGNVDISNPNKTNSFISAHNFSQDVWNKFADGNLYLTEIALKNRDVFDKLPDEYNNWKKYMKEVSQKMGDVLFRAQIADNSNDFTSIARDFKGVVEVLHENITNKWNTNQKQQNTQTNNECENLTGYLFNKLFSGCGVQDAAKGMGEGISKIVDGLWKISNQIGHGKTIGKDSKQYSFIGDKNTDLTFIYIAAMLLSYLENTI